MCCPFADGHSLSDADVAILFVPLGAVPVLSTDFLF